jgi:hypothetical protein
MGDTTFTMLPEADTSRWHELLNVVQVAELVTQYFGARPDGGRTLAENFGNVPFKWCYAHPQFERATAMELTALVQSHERLNGPIPAEQYAHLITLIEKRLNADSQIRADYLLKLGPKPIAGETWQQALNRLHRCISEVRTSMKKNESYGDPNKVHRNPLSPRRAASDEVVLPTPLLALQRRSVNTGVAPPPPVPVCRCCGHHGHQRDACPHLYQSDANNTDSSWAESYLGRVWLRHGHSHYEPDLVLPGYEERYSINTHGLVSLGSAPSSSKHARFEGQVPRGDQRRKNSQHHYQPGQPRCKSPPPLALVSAPLLSPLPCYYILVTIFLDQTGRRKGTPPTPDRQGHVETTALLDTGSLAGDFISQRVVTQLHGESLSYADPHPTTVCSGRDSTCYSSMLA